MASIVYWDRQNQREEKELVYGDAGVRFLYENKLGHVLVETLLSKKLPSVAYGVYQSSSFSRKKIKPFIRAFKIPMEEYEDSDYSSFNDFFIRKFRPGTRPFVMDPRKMAAPAEARYLAYEKVHSEQVFPVKGADLTPEALLGRRDIARTFEGGSLLIARLCPVDYHRFHFPDWGRTWDSYRIHGKYHSVNPVALKYRSEIFFTNERQVSLLETKNFGRLAYIEVGALCVGKIVQSHLRPDFERGDEKGYFLFGGSTVILMGEAGAWKPSEDLLRKTSEKCETLVRLGEQIADKL
jgi:phosphatidylserine decarboxylase